VFSNFHKTLAALGFATLLTLSATWAFFPVTQLLADQLVRWARQGYPMAFPNYGRFIVVKKRPVEVLTFGLGPAELLIELGLENSLAGRADLNLGGSPQGKLKDFFSTIKVFDQKSIADFEASKNGPDFAYGFFPPQAPELNLEFLPTYVSKAPNVDSYLSEIHDIGMIFGVELKALSLAERIEADLAILAGPLAKSDPVRVLTVVPETKDTLAVYGGESFVSDLILRSGGINSFFVLDLNINNNIPHIEPITQSLDHEPEFIIIALDGSKPREKILGMVKAHPLLSNLEVVNTDRFMTIDLASLLPGPSLNLTARKIASALHPEIVHLFKFRLNR
jgi:ABC-type Fe3+-hydroxamate transport system substrate-binding protein